MLPVLAGLLATLASFVPVLSPPGGVGPPPPVEPRNGKPADAPGSAQPAPDSPPERVAPAKTENPVSPVRTVKTTAYCRGPNGARMASGAEMYVGAVASRDWEIGTTVRLADSPWGAREFVVEDRPAARGLVDFAMPGDCEGARVWGVRRVEVTSP